MIRNHKATLDPSINFYFSVDGAALCSHVRINLSRDLRKNINNN